MIDVKGKRLLVLGGNYSTVEVVRLAKSMGIYTLVASNEEGGKAKEIADEKVLLDTGDIDAVVQYIKEHRVDGVMTGPSEFHTLNMIKICTCAGLPCYVTEEQWNQCQMKDTFKEMCRRSHVPTIEEYTESRVGIRYPVIVKPVDGCSSKGITKCYNDGELENAVAFAKRYSERDAVLVERFVETDGYGASARYIANNGEIKLSLVGDRYIVDKEKVLLCGLSVYPSKWTDRYIKEVNPHVVKMFEGIGIKQGSFFMQALPEEDFYFHEMGLRLSGGLTFKITEPLTGINDMKMMIRYAVGGEFATQEEMRQVDPYLGGKYAAILALQLNVGKIQSIEGLPEIESRKEVTSINQYYFEGDEVEPQCFGTQMQHLCRVKFVVDAYSEIIDMVNYIQKTIKVLDADGHDMIYKYFDTNRLK